MFMLMLAAACQAQSETMQDQLLLATTERQSGADDDEVVERNARFVRELVTAGFGRPLRLIGTATWNEHYLPLFMAGLYIPEGVARNRAADELTPRRMELVWRNRLLAADRIGRWWQQHFRSQFSRNEDWQRNQPRIEEYVTRLAKASPRHRWVFEYQPDAGTVLYVNGRKVLHFVGADINRALWNIWLGERTSPVFRKNITGKLGL